MQKQKFNGQLFSTRKVVNNIIRIFQLSEQPNEWYEEAHILAQNLAYKYLGSNQGASLAKVCGIIAALSPLKSWDENKKIAESFLRDGRAKHTKMMSDKAKAILNGSGEIDEISEILNGLKITSFFLNILDPFSSAAVTIDRHAVSIAIGKKVTGDKLKMTGNQYEFFANCYRIAGAKLNLRPLTVQSTTWTTWRELK